MLRSLTVRASQVRRQHPHTSRLFVHVYTVILPNHVCTKIDLAKFSRNTTLLTLPKILFQFSQHPFSKEGCPFIIQLNHAYLNMPILDILSSLLPVLEAPKPTSGVPAAAAEQPPGTDGAGVPQPQLAGAG